MENIKEILVFFGATSRLIMSHLLLAFMWFIVILPIVIAVFFIQLNTFPSSIFFFLFSMIVFIIAQLLKSRFFTARRFKLNIAYLNFIKQTPLQTDIEENKQIAAYSRKLKRDGSIIRSKRLLLAFLALNVLFSESMMVPKERMEQFRVWARKYFFYELLVFVLLLLPFALISLIFTIGLNVLTKILIFEIGFLLVWFVEGALVTPLIDLLLQKKLFLLINNSE